MTTTQFELLLVALLLVFAFFSATWVNAMSRLTKGRAEALAVRTGAQGKLLIRLAEDPAAYISGVLLLMLMSRVSATVLVTALIIRKGLALAEIVGIVVMTFVLFQIAEVAPRTWVLERLDRVLLMSARPVFWLGSVMKPVTAVLLKLSRVFLLILPGRGLPRGPITSEEEIKSILDVAESEEVIEAEEREMIHSIFEFGDTVVREVMVPRPDMICVDSSSDAEQVLELALKKGFSRIPVIDENIDDVKGIIYTKDLMKKIRSKAKPKKAAELAREATFVPESKKVSELLREMQRSKTHMVIVVDEYGGTSGLATMEDLLEEIVGEIADEYDREEPQIEEIEKDSWRVSARMGIDELNDKLGAALPDSEWDSVGGLVGGILGRVASEGDVIRVDGVEFEVEKTKGRRIEKVLVRRAGGS